MPLVEIGELNGQVGNTDYFAKSQVAEHHVLATVSRLIQRPIAATVTAGRHACDFTTSQNILGDVKIWSGSAVKVEIGQTHQGVRKPGWYQQYQKLANFGGLLAINHWDSAYHGQGVFKIRWIPWTGIQKAVTASKPLVNQRGIWCELDPTRVDHIWLGDFLEVPSAYGSRHKAFDASRIYSNNNLNIQDLYKWF